MNSRGVVSFVLVFVVMAVVLIVLFALVIPIITDMNTMFYTAGEGILIDANTSAQGITNPEIRQQLTDSFGAAANATPQTIDILNVLYQYSWLIGAVVLALTIFISSRQFVQVGTGVT